MELRRKIYFNKHLRTRDPLQGLLFGGSSGLHGQHLGLAGRDLGSQILF
jgi:hypothetical protein